MRVCVYTCMCPRTALQLITKTAFVISDKIGFKVKLIAKDKEGLFKMINFSQEIQM